MNEYTIEAYTNKILAKDTVIETLKELNARGDSLNVLTASPHIMLAPCLKRLEVLNLFDNVWSCDDFNTTKSDPKIYRAAAERIGPDVSEVIFVDDNVNAVKTARAAGMSAYGIYDASSAEYENEMRAVSDRYIKCLAELLDA